ncbi:MAG: hypothetical protein COB19_03330 [Porticoccus sp.]|nr:MAG: hypothetical protein COB19_03330 [Porticoccus sp.]
MVEHEILECPRCHKAFECKLGSITICQCSDVSLMEVQKEWIGQQWDSCLCKDCLLAIKQGETERYS